MLNNNSPTLQDWVTTDVGIRSFLYDGGRHECNSLVSFAIEIPIFNNPVLRRKCCCQFLITFCFILKTFEKTTPALRSGKDLKSRETKGIITTLPRHIMWTKLDQKQCLGIFLPPVNSGEMLRWKEIYRNKNLENRKTFWTGSHLSKDRQQTVSLQLTEVVHSLKNVSNKYF